MTDFKEELLRWLEEQKRDARAFVRKHGRGNIEGEHYQGRYEAFMECIAYIHLEGGK